MGRTTLVQDIVAICLHLSDGDLDTSLEDIINRVEQFQVEEKRHFGISVDDFRGLMTMLVFERLGARKIFALEKNSVRKLIAEMLKYHDAYFNDEGDHWFGVASIGFSYVEYLAEQQDEYLADQQAEYAANRLRKLKCKMGALFEQTRMDHLQTEEVVHFMEENGITNKVLFRCSYPGFSS